jgi:hypothetical protein
MSWTVHYYDPTSRRINRVNADWFRRSPFAEAYFERGLARCLSQMVTTQPITALTATAVR